MANNKDSFYKTETLLSPKEVAVFLGVHEKTILRYMSALTNPLPAYKLSSKVVRIKESDLHEWLEDQPRDK